MQKADTRKRLLLFIIGLFLALSALLVYHPVRHHGVTNCDDFYITENSFLEKSAWNPETLVYVMTTVTAGVWMPITTLLIGHEYFIFGTDYGMYHVVCLLFHIANGLLLFFTLRLMTGALWKSALVAALFTLHPLNVEPVAWLVGIRVVLCGFFALIAFAFYALHIRRRSSWSYTMALFAFAVSLTSVPMYMTLPCVLLLIDYWPLERLDLFKSLPGENKPVFNWPETGRLVWEKMPFFVLILGMSAIVMASHDLPFVYHYPLSQRLLNIPIAYLQYLKRLFYPIHLSVFYPFPTVFPVWKVAGASLVLLAITAVALRTAATHRYFIVGWLWFAGMMVPLTGIVQIGTQAMADHYMYLPMIGPLAAVVWGVDSVMGDWKPKPVVFCCAAFVALLTFGVLSAKQVKVWENSFTLSQHALAVTENNYEAHNYLGHAFAEKGDIEQAIYQFTQALAIKPDHAKSHHNLANSYMRTGNVKQAEYHYRQAVLADPANALTYNSLGVVLAAQGRLPEAIDCYQESLALAPGYFQAHSNLAIALAASGRLKDAEEQFREALAIQPDMPAILFNLADVLASSGKHMEAAEYLEKVLTTDPAMVKARLKLAEVLLAVGRFEEAADNYGMLITLFPESAELNYLAGLAYYESGHADQARSHLARALAINPAMGKARDLLSRVSGAPVRQTD